MLNSARLPVFPKVENPCLTFGQASKKNCLTEPKLAGPKNMKKIQDSFRQNECNRLHYDYM
jgi:hypothetical protein